MPLTVRLNARTERALDALARSRRQTQSDVVREALEQFTASNSGGAARSRPYDAGSTSSGSSAPAPANERERQVSSSLRSSARRHVRGVLVDAGSMVALLDQGDPRHADCVAAIKEIADPLVTVWPAFTEAMYWPGRPTWRGQKALWSRLETGAGLAPLDEDDASRMRELMENYRDLPMDLADAALVRVAEREDVTRIFTLDRRHFSVYRPGRRRRFAILP